MPYDITSASIDYYVGRGEDAEYLGTERARATSISLPHWSLFCSLDKEDFTEESYRAVVAQQLDSASTVGGTEWPHPHRSSDETGWTYCYDKGSVYVYRYGVEMQVWRCNAERWVKDGPESYSRESRPVNRFPIHRARKADAR
jgi:hypothetical protein